MGFSESLGHIQTGKIPGPLLIHVFPYCFTHHPRGSVLSSCSVHNHRPEKDNIRQRNLTFDTQMQGWPPDLNPPAVGEFAVDSHPGRNEGMGQRAEVEKVSNVEKTGPDNEMWRLLHH